MDNDKSKSKKDIINRLRRIEGQVKGIQGMVEQESCCTDILVQVSAIRSAINKVGGLIIENYAGECLNIDKDEKQEEIKKLIKTMVNFTK
ncbi:metal-sensitive transcriptional regulator [Clostridium uliginosum]|nr:metal-sensitive transcriptional regulator [Clostridium uliginosum]